MTLWYDVFGTFFAKINYFPLKTKILIKTFSFIIITGWQLRKIEPPSRNTQSRVMRPHSKTKFRRCHWDTYHIRTRLNWFLWKLLGFTTPTSYQNSWQINIRRTEKWFFWKKNKTQKKLRKLYLNFKWKNERCVP